MFSDLFPCYIYRLKILIFCLNHLKMLLERHLSLVLALKKNVAYGYDSYKVAKVWSISNLLMVDSQSETKSALEVTLPGSEVIDFDNEFINLYDFFIKCLTNFNY